MDPWLLDAANRPEVERYLTAQGLVSNGALPIAVARAGAGNMNLTLRVTLADGRSFVVKQGRPWVEKYPQIPAPFERTLVEAAFYDAIRPYDVASGMPALVHVDAANHVLVLEDIRGGGDWTAIYSGERLSAATLGALLEWLERLAQVTVAGDARRVFENRAMRALNHEHIFDFPLRTDNGLELDGITPGLSAAARELAIDRAYCEIVNGLGKRYLDDGPVLVHGDYFPGSWLRADGGVRVIDPEFCFMGDAEFDCGVLAAHLMLAGCDRVTMSIVAASVAARHIDPLLVSRYAGVEIMRRLIGVAQLPLAASLDRKRALLALSRRLVLDPGEGLA